MIHQSDLFSTQPPSPSLESVTAKDFKDEARIHSKRLSHLMEWLSKEEAKQPDDGEQDRAWRTRPRAFVLEFAGMPKAGKSSVIKEIRQYFQYAFKPNAKFIVDTPAEGVSLRTPGRLLGNLAEFNTWAGAYALQELLVARNNDFHDIVILDRGPWDAGCWLQYLETHQEDEAIRRSYSRKDLQTIRNFFHQPIWAGLSDLHIVMTIDPETALSREAESSLIEPGGITRNLAAMNSMRSIYKDNYKRLLSQKSHRCKNTGHLSVLELDTTSMTKHEAAWRVILKTLDLIEAKLDSASPSHQTTRIPSDSSSLTAETAIERILKPYKQTLRRGHYSEAYKTLAENYTERRFRTSKLSALLKEFELKIPKGFTVLSNRAEAAAIIERISRELDEL